MKFYDLGTYFSLKKTTEICLKYPLKFEKAKLSRSLDEINLLVAKKAMEFNDEFIFFFSKIATLEVRP